MYFIVVLVTQVLITKSCSLSLLTFALSHITDKSCCIFVIGMCEPVVIISAVKRFNFGFNYSKVGFHGDVMKEEVLWG